MYYHASIWSPTGEYIIAGRTDNTARVFAAVDGKCVYEIAEHSHYVQGVAWDPLNEYIATQSSDRSMHVYHISSKPGGAFEAHAVGKNTRMPQSRSRRHSRTPSAHGGHGTSKPRMLRRGSNTSDMDSAVFDWGKDVEDAQSSTSALTSGYSGKDATIPLTPATSVGSAPSATFMFPDTQGNVIGGQPGCYNLIPVFDWIRRCIVSIFLVFMISFLPLFLQGISPSDAFLFGLLINNLSRTCGKRYRQGASSTRQTFPFIITCIRSFFDPDLL